MINAGVGLFPIGRKLGRPNHKSTMRYSHLVHGTLPAAMEAGARKTAGQINLPSPANVGGGTFHYNFSKAIPMTNNDPTLFDDLRRLDSDCPGNRHDKLAVLMAACIEREIDTRGRLIAVLSHLGYRKAHVVIILKEFLGSWWRVDDQQRYSLLI